MTAIQMCHHHRLIDDEALSSACAQSEEGDFRWAVETERHADGTDAAIDVQSHAAKLKPALNKSLTHGRKNERADQRQADLAAVGVAAEHQVNSLPRRYATERAPRSRVRGIAAQQARCAHCESVPEL